MEAGARQAGIADFFAAVGLARVKSFIDERFFVAAAAATVPTCCDGAKRANKQERAIAQATATATARPA